MNIWIHQIYFAEHIFFFFGLDEPEMSEGMFDAVQIKNLIRPPLSFVISIRLL